MIVHNLQRFIEHTLLYPTTKEEDILQLTQAAKEFEFVGVCVPPFWVKKVKRELEESDVQVVTVVGFPFGYQMTETKVFETKQAIKNGADEIDVVWSLTAFKSGMNWPKIELAKLASVCHEEEKIIKVILETAYLNEGEIKEACKICSDAGADFVKTSTGFAPEGATLENIRLIRSCLPSNVGVKASGGIKTAAQAIALLKAGADRLGTSSGVSIMEEWSQTQD
ncbi:deoxyribose-phosphate aldolase [Echinicola jeungdonensis]|uniref:Deoxyribose-phosphate aldolase n=1 Tax=Echinicola jeungdonensis TaxID=709343 RepID=A0ABV5JA39_9BACT|nr:deoxyribose-phosphate aldolase [Echinicola jeungdonensis]MDN3669428.1 deoxyribose-phosphate aldolase [Echinicola jeungdonensis]